MIPTSVREKERNVFTDTLAKIAKDIMPEKIICFGSRTSYEEGWSNFLPTGNDPHCFTYYDLLIITKEGDERREHEILNKINTYNKGPIRITALVHSINAVNTALLEGSYFFVTLYHKGVVVYDNNNTPLKPPNVEFDEQEYARKTDKSWSRSFALSQKFYKVAVNCATDDLHDVAVLMLHQAVEHACIAIIRYYLGYRPATHNLSRLLWLMENFTSEGMEIFPQITDQEIELFNVLLRAYSDVRYKHDYKVSTETVFILIDRVNSLLEAIDQLYHKKKTSSEPSPAESEIRQQLPHFESICLDTFADVVLQKGDHESIHVESAKDLADTFKFIVEDKRLWVSTALNKIDTVGEATLFICYTSLNALVVNHSGNITCKEPIEAQWLGIVQNGNGNIELEISVTTLDATLNKAGNLAISGSAAEARVLNHGSGNLVASQLIATSAHVVIRGLGNVSIHCEEELSGELNGSGNLLIKGSPRLKSLSIKGTGSLKPI